MFWGGEGQILKRGQGQGFCDHDSDQPPFSLGEMIQKTEAKISNSQVETELQQLDFIMLHFHPRVEILKSQEMQKTLQPDDGSFLPNWSSIFSAPNIQYFNTSILHLTFRVLFMDFFIKGQYIFA